MCVIWAVLHLHRRVGSKTACTLTHSWIQSRGSFKCLIHQPQHTATHCNTLQHTATHCNTLQHTATHCNTLQHTATHRGAHSCNAFTKACVTHWVTYMTYSSVFIHSLPFMVYRDSFMWLIRKGVRHSSWNFYACSRICWIFFNRRIEHIFTNAIRYACIC